MNSKRSDLVAKFVDAEHFRYRPQASPPANSFLFPRRATFFLGAPETPLVRRAMENFSSFFRQCFATELVHSDDRADIVFRLSGEGPDESFVIDVAVDGVLVEASHEKGLLHATHYLERLMADAGGPFLSLGRLQRQPALSPRFTESIFIPPRQLPSNPGLFSDEYLGLMSHFGSNALKFYINLFDLWRSDTLPELNTPDFDEQISHLQRFVQRLSEFGFDLHLHLNTGPLAADHAVFSAYPEVKGSRVEIAVEEVSGFDWNVLCSSNLKVHRAYQETLGAVFSAIPDLGGVVMIIGGECFFHCFTRPANSVSGETSCPHCQGRDAHQEVATLVNAVHAAIPAGRRLFAWPYSAFIWSGDDRLQSRWISHLNPAVDVLANFDCFDEDEMCGVGVRFFDYNIKLIGPSSVFWAQRDACRDRGIRINVKTETTTTPDSFYLPYLPLHFRWYERYKAIRESGASGYMGQWRFYGMNGTIPEELQYHSVWNPERTAEELLSTIVRRDFGLGGAALDSVIEAWRLLSASWDDFPYSAMTSGERDAYMRGPWYLGPAHPLIFSPQSRYDLDARFFNIRGDLVEGFTEEELAAMHRRPRYIDDLWICLPFGVDRFLEFSKKCSCRWDAGLEMLKKALGDSPNQRAQMELDVCETVSIHLNTLTNTVEFLRLRDSVARGPQTKDSLTVIWSQLRDVLDREIANAARALPILQRDPRIGFGFSYGEVYDREMVEQKIAQCRHVRHAELPRVESFLRFHIWQA